MLRAMSVKHGPRDAAAFLRTNTVFGRLPAREIELLGSAAVEETRRAHEFVFLEGDPAKWFCVVKSRSHQDPSPSRTGKDVVLELLGPGEVFGGIAVIEQRPYPAAAQATDAVVVLKIPAEAMIAVSERQPSLVKELALMIGRRLPAAHDSVKSLAVDPVASRLAAALLRRAEREAHGTRTASPFRSISPVRVWQRCPGPPSRRLSGW
jgi:CRP/FNR family transcriptional regulator, nitrogen oxide reductase regulator